MTTAKSLFRRALFVARGQDGRVQTMLWLNNKKPASQKEIIERIDLIEMALCEPNDELTKAAVEAAANLAGFSKEAGQAAFKIAKDGVVSPDPIVRREIHGRLAQFLSCYSKGVTKDLLRDVTEDAVANGTATACGAITEILSRKPALVPEALEEVFIHELTGTYQDEVSFFEALTTIAPFCGDEDMRRLFNCALVVRERVGGDPFVNEKAQALMGCLCTLDSAFAAQSLPNARRAMGSLHTGLCGEGFLTALAIVRHGQEEQKADATDVIEKALSSYLDPLHSLTLPHRALASLFEEIPFGKDEPAFDRSIDVASDVLVTRKQDGLLRVKAAAFLSGVCKTAPEKISSGTVASLIQLANEPFGDPRERARDCLDNLMVHAPERFDRAVVDGLFRKMYTSSNYGKGTYARQLLVRLRASKDGKLIL